MLRRINWRSKKLWIGVGIVVLVLVVYWLIRAREEEKVVPTGPGVGQPGATAAPGGAGGGETPSETRSYPLEINSNVDKWVGYTGDTSYAFKYPEEVDIKVDPDGMVTLSKFGPTQVEASEYYDSIYVNLLKVKLEGATLEQKAYEKASNYTSSEESIVSGVERVEYGGKQGFEFMTNNNFRYIYLPIDNESYLLVVDGSKDPGGLGYRQVVDGILETIE